MEYKTDNMSTNSTKTHSLTTHILMGTVYYKCNYCEKFYDEVWISKSRTTCCCRHCWGNNPIVARATLGKPFRPSINLFTQ